MRKGLFSMLAVVVAMSASAADLKRPPASVFAKPPSFIEVTISPNGTYIAALFARREKFDLIVFETATMKPTAHLNGGGDRTIADYAWASDHRLIVEPGIFYGTDEAPGRTGELFGVDADGKNMDYLFGYRGAQSTGTAIEQSNEAREASATILRGVVDQQHSLVAVADWGERSEVDPQRTFWINDKSGRLEHQVSAPRPFPDGTSFLADEAGEIRYASGFDENSLWHSYLRVPADNKWWELAAMQGNTNSAIVPLKLSPDVTTLYFLSPLGDNASAGRNCLAAEDLKTGKVSRLSCDPVMSVASVIWSFDRHRPIAVAYDSGKATVRLLDEPSPDQDILRKLMAAFPGNVVEPVSSSEDGHFVILFVHSDRDPGGYYLFDTRLRKAQPLFAEVEGIDPEQMAERRPIQYVDRQGVTIHGYLTLPQGRVPKNLPMVVLPHGGPFWIYDTQYWDAEAEFLASRGYLVLQPNFRGSGGYGSVFRDAGKQGWGTAMIDDITDGTRWAIAQGYADQNRICIFGSSYGGYAALMSAVREPDLYKCAIGYDGVYDLRALAKNSDTAEEKSGRNYLADFMGKDPEVLKEQSPITYIDRIKAAVMIIHGKDDLRAPFEQAEALRSALDKQHHSYDWLVKAGEGHGFFDQSNREEVLNRLQAFLENNIGPGAPVAISASATVPSPSKTDAPATGAGAPATR